ncbi:phosphatidylinositol glycan anchor biosynthesis class X isoform X1 [Tachypleus tridentatus]|uniref:phosphatidylinositol glycan anchor biosynthesis class X isoform X1 n=1 Tax=Tachypleus tridentatus TaxID=6853 RepID=UPI003FD5A3C7
MPIKYNISLIFFYMIIEGNPYSLNSFISAQKDSGVLHNQENSQCVYYSVYVRRKLEPSGYHRNLVTELHWNNTDLDKDNLLGRTHFLVVETFPSSVYVDPYQLGFLQESGFPEVLVSSAVDVEKPARTSPELTVYEFMPLIKDTTKLQIPVHFRYQSPHDCETRGYFVSVTLHLPQAFIRWKKSVIMTSRKDIDFWTLSMLALSNGVHDSIYVDRSPCVGRIDAPCDSKNTSLCHWYPLLIVPDGEECTVEVPVGCTQDKPSVLVVTTIVTVIAVLWIVYSVMAANKSHKKDN